jgi:hypothetical protein
VIAVGDSKGSKNAPRHPASAGRRPRPNQVAASEAVEVVAARAIVRGLLAPAHSVGGTPRLLRRGRTAADRAVLVGSRTSGGSGFFREYWQPGLPLSGGARSELVGVPPGNSGPASA